MILTEDNGPQMVRFKVTMQGMVYGVQNVKAGDLVEIPTRTEALRLYAQGYAQDPDVEKLGRPYEPFGEHRPTASEPVGKFAGP